ncbi:MAG: aspartate kinase [Anaerolineales bacterium]|nr:aspartate kinase [Anaerolineales bacterium]MCX7753902.1 aspartate kinase [Anaerolineales bacterium]MDW8276856.1 aspartate kinase [Anaerolineales bacterium]
MSQQSSPGTLVMKFGGTSVGSARAMTNVVQIVREARSEWPRVVVITSALSGVTNLLLESAAQAARGETAQLPEAEQTLLANHQTIATSLIPEEARRTAVLDEIAGLVRSFVELCHAISVLGEATSRALDAVASLGERMSVRLLAAVLESAGIPSKAIEASELIVTDDHFQSAHPDFSLTTERTRRILLPLLEQGLTPVITGFLGATRDGIVTTLGRGGSDYSAGIIGAVLPADDVWIWTDVDGVMTADPRLVPQAQTLSQISYSEIAELAYFGAKVLHPKTIRPVVEAGIGLRICNTFNPSHPGTRLIANGKAEKPQTGEKVIKAVTAIRKQRLVTIEGRGMLGVPGVAARAFAAVASTGTSVPLITQASSEQSICFSIPSEASSAVLTALEKTFAAELTQRDIDRVWASEDVSIITVVGHGTRHTPGVAGQIFTQLGRAGINVLAIAHGSSDVSISMVVESAETEKAVKALHELIVA